MENNRWPRYKPHTHSHLIFDKGNKYTHWRKDSILTNSTAKIQCLYAGETRSLYKTQHQMAHGPQQETWHSETAAGKRGSTLLNKGIGKVFLIQIQSLRK